jgi:chemotaxis protein CheX
MKKILVNSLLKSIPQVLSETLPSLEFKPDSGSTVTESHIVLSSGLFVIVGLAGELKGRLIITFDIDSAKKIAQKMLMEEDDIPDDLAFSCITEMANIITGYTLCRPELTEKNLEMSPPTIFSGKSIILENPLKSIEKFTFSSGEIKFEILIAVE